MSSNTKIKIASDKDLMKQLRGNTVRPAIRFIDKKKEQNRKACRGKNWD